MAESQINGLNPLEARRKSASERKAAWKAGVQAEAERAQVSTTRTPKKRALISLLEDRFPGYQPVMEMAEKARRISEIADQRPSDALAQMDAVNAHEKVAKYVSPQLKAVDLSSGGEQISFGFSLNLGFSLNFGFGLSLNLGLSFNLGFSFAIEKVQQQINLPVAESYRAKLLP